jgi:hypothetical protein
MLVPLLPVALPLTPFGGLLREPRPSMLVE